MDGARLLLIITNLRPDGNLKEERPKHVVAQTLHQVNKYYKL